MKNLVTVLLSLAVLLLIYGCPEPIKKKTYYHDARFPTKPVNLTDVNSIYDDYNSALPEYHFGKALIFSSNRSTSGGEFDLNGDKFHVTWFIETGELRVDNSNYWQKTYYVAAMLQEVSWQGDQFGPYAIGFDSIIDGVNKRINLLAYSTNNGTDTFQEEFVYHESEDEGETGIVKGPFVIAGLSDTEKQYISFYGPEVVGIDSWFANPNLFTQMYFNKTEGGVSNIYRIDIPDSVGFMQFLSDSVVYQHDLVNELSSSKNDFCPFVNGNYMVFASDRPGGYGGYDLYYSVFDGTEWSAPVNFGENINTAYNEFRPVSMQVDQFNNDVMLFSSDRPGGQGGYDLYYVGIDKFGPVIITIK